jgi:PTH1 family peptidyl-tRNA hydrolase
MDQTLIMGLGNPDQALLNTYHNVGVLAVEWLAGRADAEAGASNAGNEAAPKFRTYKDTFAYVKIGGLVFIRPLVYMNESGRAAHDALHVFGAAPKDLLVIHDDSDIPVGDLKRAQGGGSAGHKGIASIIDHLHTEDFARIRIGIRARDEIHRKKAGDFVLSVITPADKKIFESVFQTIADDVDARSGSR